MVGGCHPQRIIAVQHGSSNRRTSFVEHQRRAKLAALYARGTPLMKRECGVKLTGPEMLLFRRTARSARTGKSADPASPFFSLIQ